MGTSGRFYFVRSLEYSCGQWTGANSPSLELAALEQEALATSCSSQNSLLQSFISTFRILGQRMHASTVKPVDQDHGKTNMRSMVGLGANKSGSHAFIYIHPKQAQWTKCKKYWAKQWPVQFVTAAKPGTCCLSIERFLSMLETWTYNNWQTKLWCGSMFHCLAEMKSPSSGMWWLIQSHITREHHWQPRETACIY